MLDVCKRRFDQPDPVAGMDEPPKQPVAETRDPTESMPGIPTRNGYDCKRCGMCNISVSSEPLPGRRMIEVCERKTKKDWAFFLEKISCQYRNANRTALAVDNISKHVAGPLHEVFNPEKAKNILDIFEFVYTPKHGSWPDIAEIEPDVPAGQCLIRRIESIEAAGKEAVAWQNFRNNKNAKADWQSATQDARTELKRLCPTIDA